MDASVLLDIVGLQLSDPGENRWTESKKIDYLNAALLQLVSVDVTAHNELKTVQLSAGTEQTIPSGDLQFLTALRNMGDDGSTPGESVRMVDRRWKDAYSPGWHAADGSNPVREVLYDPEDRKHFWVYPAASTPWHLQIRTVTAPTEITASGDTIPVDDAYQNALMYWMLHLAYAENTDAASKQHAASYEERFYNAVGARLQSYPPKRMRGQ